MCMDTLWHSERLKELLRPGYVSHNWPLCAGLSRGPAEKGEGGQPLTPAQPD